jgi:hypothetical protein
MSTSASQTKTFTKADIRKVIENFSADFFMIVEATGLHSRDYVAKITHDLNIFAEFDCLIQVMLLLKDKNGKKLKAAVYTVSNSAIGWSADRPGNNLWPRTTDGTLSVIATMTSAWNNKTESQKADFVKNYSLNWAWSASTSDSSVMGLSSASAQQYASNGYGWERKNYS